MSNDEVNLPKDICSECTKPKVKVFKMFHSASYKKTDEKSGNERALKKRRRKYSDETGRLWHGKICPDCSMIKRSQKNSDRTESQKEELKKLLDE
jgi:hypothetical protein